MEERSHHSQVPAQPKPAWYPDPTDPSGGRMRYWDGAAWTDHYAAPRRSSKAAWTGAAALLAVPMVLYAVREGEDSGARAFGGAVGVALVSIAIALAIRAIYVKLFAKDQRIISPWLLVIAAVVGLGSFLGNAGEDTENDGFSSAATPVTAQASR